MISKQQECRESHKSFCSVKRIYIRLFVVTISKLKSGTPSCLKVMGGGGGWWWLVVAWSNVVSAQGPLVLDLGLKCLGLRVWGQCLTKRKVVQFKHLLRSLILRYAHTTTAEYQVFYVAVSNAETDRCLP